MRNGLWRRAGSCTALTQTLAGLHAGDNRVTFVQSCRKDATENQFMSHKLKTVLKIDGNDVVAAGPFETPNYDFVRVAAFVRIETTGDHVLTLATSDDTNREGAMVFVDDCQQPIADAPDTGWLLAY